MNHKTARGREPRRRQRTRIRSFVTALQVTILLGLSASVGIGLAMFVGLSGVLPKMQIVEAPEATIIYSSDNVVLARIFREDRTNVPLKDIPENLRNATIAAEDARFYSHPGVDMRGVARAVWGVIRQDKTTGGGSTITQQLARNVFLSRRKTLERKAQEAVLAILMERHFTKDKILELYLNRVYYGSGAFGVQAASKVYFGKNVDQLSLSECAMLAGMPQRPSSYSPHESIKAATGRRDTVLRLMQDNGFIGPEEREKAAAEKLHIVPLQKGRTTYKAPHFVDYVTRQLKERYGDDVVFSGGLRVHTTLNFEMQKIAEKALREGVKKHERTRRVSEGCFVAIEPATGYVRAMVGSVDPKSYYNRCTQGFGRQPGSAFKPFVYAAAFEKLGWSPSKTIVDGFFSAPGGGGKAWTPKNYDNRWHGTVTIKRAIAQSINIPAIKTAQQVGVENVIKYARAMGIKAELEPYLSIAIGGIKGVHPIDMASAYGTFANGGVHVEPCSIVRVTNGRGEIIEDYVPEGRLVLKPRTNAYIDECLREVVVGPYGTGKNARGVPEARGKTGTTNDDKDAWFIGYVPGKLVAACWVGNDDWTPMRRAYGGLVCAPVWKEFMLKAVPIYDRIHKDAQRQAAKRPERRNRAEQPSRVRDEEPRETPPPDTEADVAVTDNAETVSLRICDDSQLLATSGCPSDHTERFVKGTEPTSYCTTHRAAPEARTGGTREAAGNSASDETLVTVTVCRDSGLLAGVNCPRIRKRIPIGDVPTRVCEEHTSR